MEKLKDYTFNQVKKALINKGFRTDKTFGCEMFGFMTMFIKESDTRGLIIANVDELPCGTTLVNGENPSLFKPYN